MHKIYNHFVGQTNDQMQLTEALDATFQMVKTGQDLIDYFIITKKIFFLNQYKQHIIRYLCLSTRLLYNIIQYAKENTTNYLVRFQNEQVVIESCNGSLVPRWFQ